MGHSCHSYCGWLQAPAPFRKWAKTHYHPIEKIRVLNCVTNSYQLVQLFVHPEYDMVLPHVDQLIQWTFYVLFGKRTAMQNHHFLIGKSTINGPCSMAMLNYQRVINDCIMLVDLRGWITCVAGKKENIHGRDKPTVTMKTTIWIMCIHLSLWWFPISWWTGLNGVCAHSAFRILDRMVLRNHGKDFWRVGCNPQSHGL